MRWCWRKMPPYTGNRWVMYLFLVLAVANIVGFGVFGGAGAFRWVQVGIWLVLLVPAVAGLLKRRQLQRAED